MATWNNSTPSGQKVYCTHWGAEYDDVTVNQTEQAGRQEGLRPFLGCSGLSYSPVKRMALFRVIDVT